MSKHTPGPWVTYRGKNWSGQSMVDWKSTVVRPVVNGRVMSITIAKCDNEYNAKLISAAPDLLAALQGILRVADRVADEFDAARAAIAKAIGVD